MIFRRWSHGHNIGTGVLGGLLLSEHGWTVAVLAFTLGLVAGSFAYLLRGIGERLRREKPNFRNGWPPLRTVPPLDVLSLRRITFPVEGLPGVRVDAQGREWYSAAWLSDGAA